MTTATAIEGWKMSDIAELKPCPFCGGQNAMMFEPTCRPETPYNPSDRLFPVVRCMSCYAEACGENEDYRGQTAIEAWNTRPVEASLSSRIAGLEANGVLLQARVREMQDLNSRMVAEWAALREQAGVYP